MLAARRLWSMACRTEHLAALRSLTGASDCTWAPHACWRAVDPSPPWPAANNVVTSMPADRAAYSSKTKRGDTQARGLSEFHSCCVHSQPLWLPCLTRLLVHTGKKSPAGSSDKQPASSPAASGADRGASLDLAGVRRCNVLCSSKCPRRANWCAQQLSAVFFMPVQSCVARRGVGACAVRWSA